MPSNTKVNKLLKLLIAGGMLPLILQLAMTSVSKDTERLPIELGRKSSSGLPIKFTNLNFLQFAKEERKLNFEVEDVKELLAMPSHLRFLKLPIVFRINPENVFAPNFSVDMLKMGAGNTPTRLLIPSAKASRFGRLAISWGIHY